MTESERACIDKIKHHAALIAESAVQIQYATRLMPDMPSGISVTRELRGAANQLGLAKALSLAVIERYEERPIDLRTLQAAE